MKLAVDIFMKLDGMDGEVKDRMHAKEIEVIAWSWGATQNSASPWVHVAVAARRVYMICISPNTLIVQRTP